MGRGAQTAREMLARSPALSFPLCWRLRAARHDFRLPGPEDVRPRLELPALRRFHVDVVVTPLRFHFAGLTVQTYGDQVDLAGGATRCGLDDVVDEHVDDARPRYVLAVLHVAAGGGSQLVAARRGAQDLA